LPKALGIGTILVGMELRPKGKILFLALAACMVFSVVFADVLITDDIDHDCKGEGCPICLTIETAHNFIKNLKLAAMVVFLAFSFLHCSLLPAHCSLHPTHSPVILKVRFNS
jgi:hypothetical protein